MPRKVSWLNLTPEQQVELDSLLQPPGWRVLPGSELPSLFPESFRKKIDSALLIAQASSTGGTYLAVSANRVDFKAAKIDLEPLGVIVHTTGSGSVAVFVHHGDWYDRTQDAPAGFWQDVDRSGIGTYFLANPPHGRLEGTLEQLPAGHRGAFDAVIEELRAREDGKSE